jgi:hypothetical protein
MRNLLLLIFCGCGGALTPLYPPRPAAVPGTALVEPEPSRVVVHATVSSVALGQALDMAIPKMGAGTFPLLGGQRRYVWQRQPMNVSFTQGRIKVTANVIATVEVGTLLELPITLTILGEPVIASDYRARLQSAEVQVTSDDPRLRAAQTVAGALDKIRDQIDAQLKTFAYDLRPILGEAHGRSPSRSTFLSATPTVARSCGFSPSKRARRFSPTASRRSSASWSRLRSRCLALRRGRPRSCRRSPTSPPSCPARSR